MLFGLGLGGSLLAGFGMAAAAARSWVHMVIFSGALAVTLYVVADLEFPRLGLIRLERFDHFLVDACQSARKTDPGSASNFDPLVVHDGERRTGWSWLGLRRPVGRVDFAPRLSFESGS